MINLCSWLKNCRNLQQLVLTNNPIGDLGMLAFIDAVKDDLGMLPNLQKFDLSQNMMRRTESGAEDHIQHGIISDISANAFANLLQTTEALQSLTDVRIFGGNFSLEAVKNFKRAGEARSTFFGPAVEMTIMPNDAWRKATWPVGNKEGHLWLGSGPSPFA